MPGTEVELDKLTRPVKHAFREEVNLFIHVHMRGKINFKILEADSAFQTGLKVHAEGTQWVFRMMFVGKKGTIDFLKIFEILMIRV